MSLVSGYPPQAYHGSHQISHDFYGPYHQTGRYQDHPSSTGVAGQDGSSTAASYFSNWMFSNSQGSPEFGVGVGGCGDPYGFPAPEYSMLGMMDPNGGPPRVRVVKRRTTSNKKERRRTHSINSAFAALRGCIPNVPSDTKLSKIKTLRLATSYIAYLMDVLNKEDGTVLGEPADFKAEITKKIESREEKRKREAEEILKVTQPPNISGNCRTSNNNSGSNNEKKTRGRTGWPQHVWASELSSAEIQAAPISGSSSSSGCSSSSSCNSSNSSASSHTPPHHGGGQVSGVTTEHLPMDHTTTTNCN